MTARGLRPISELIEGDLVLAWDEATGKTDYFVITDTISHVDAEIVLLTLNDETLETTAEHPFYVVEASEWSNYLSLGRWVDAGDLRVGDDVRQADGSTGEVLSVRVVAQSQPMYNLTVDQAHTFFVGADQWLVHNAGPCGQAFNIAKSGGKHSGYYQNYLGRSSDEISKGIKSIESLIAEHYDKIANPSKYLPNWNDLDPRQQKALLEKGWPSDIQRQQEQLEILQGILKERGN